LEQSAAAMFLVEHLKTCNIRAFPWFCCGAATKPRINPVIRCANTTNYLACAYLRTAWALCTDCSNSVNPAIHKILSQFYKVFDRCLDIPPDHAAPSTGSVFESSPAKMP
jgi:hypothetical protein